MLYTPDGAGPGAQAEEVILGIKLDLSYSKAEILRMYADIAYFGHGYYGLAAASCGYFGVTPDGLSWPQAALLAGMMQAPSADNPIASPAASPSSNPTSTRLGWIGLSRTSAGTAPW